MCMEDVCLGRKTIGSQVDYAAGATPFKILDHDAARYALVLGSPIANTVTFRFGENPVSGIGMNLAAGQTPIVLNIKDHGELVTKPIHVIGSGAGTNGAIWYSSLVEKCK